MKKNVTTGQLCYHPNLRPTSWDQLKPEPCKMTVCDCGKNQICPVCGYGIGCYPCDCNKTPKKDYTTTFNE